MVQDILESLKEIESGGDYRARGKDGEIGAYQFMPSTWERASGLYAKEMGLPYHRLPPTPEHQDAVAAFQVQRLLDEGHTPEQIASVWNSGSPRWEGKVGVNPQGVRYDVPGYVSKFSKTLASRLFDNLFSPSEAEASDKIRWPGDDAASPNQGGIRWPGDDQPQAAAPAAAPMGQAQDEAGIVWPDGDQSPTTWNQPPEQAANLPEWARNNPRTHKVLSGAYQALEPTIDAAGLVGGGLAGAPAGPLGSIAGAGLGYAGVQPLQRAARGALGLPSSEQPQNIPDAFIQSGKDVATGAAMEMGGGIVGRGVEAVGSGLNALKAGVGDFARRTIGAVDNPIVGAPAKQVYEDFVNAGVTPLPGAVSGNRAVAGLEQALSKMPGSSKVVQDATNKALKELGAESGRIAEEFSPAALPSKEALGDFTLTKAAEVGTRFKSQANKVYGTVDAKIGNALSDAQNVLSWVDETASKLSPGAAESFRKSVAPYVDLVKADAEAGNLNFRSLRFVRTKIGERLGNPLTADTDSASRGVLKQLENKLSADMEAAAEKEGQLALFQNVDKWYSAQKSNMGRIEALVKSGDVQKIGNAVTNPNVSAETLAALRRKLSTEDWDVAAGTVFGQIGKAKPGSQGVAGDIFSPATFLTNWNKLSPGAKDTLFGGTRYTELRSQIDRLSRVSAAMKSSEQMANTSNTAASSMWMNLLQNLTPTIGGTAGYAMWGMPGVVAGVGSGMVGPYVVAKKLITNPDFTRWLANSGRTLLNNGATDETVSRMIGRLTVVANRNPDIAEDVSLYLRNLGGSAGGADNNRK